MVRFQLTHLEDAAGWVFEISADDRRVCCSCASFCLSSKYYLRTKSAKDAIKFSLDATLVALQQEEMAQAKAANAGAKVKQQQQQQLEQHSQGLLAPSSVVVPAAAAVSTLPLMRQDTTDPALHAIVMNDNASASTGNKGNHTPRSSQHFQASELESTEANRARMQSRREQVRTMDAEALDQGSCKGGMCSA
jgi:hypothetical protein